MKRIWFKPECIQWILQRAKTTTFRRTKHEGEYKVVYGSLYKPKKTPLTITLKPLYNIDRETVIKTWYNTEGPFKTPEEFTTWLKKAGLELPANGWLHIIDEKLILDAQEYDKWSMENVMPTL